MKKTAKAFFCIVVFSLIVMSSNVLAHSGRTDASGGHNCSQKSKDKGLCTGYHYHNSGKGQATQSSNGSNAKNNSNKSSQNNAKQSNSKSNDNKKSTTLPQSDVKLSINDTVIELSKKPLVKNNTTYFPIREIANEIGATLSFNDKKTEVTLTRNNKKTTFKLDSNDIVSQNDTTYAPIRAIVEQLGGTVQYDKKKNLIIVEIK